MDSSDTTSSGDMVKQAEHIWRMLDELADTDPDAYKNFVQRSMTEKKNGQVIPEPFMCIRTEILSNASRGSIPLFVNVCSWTRVPGPKTTTDAVPVTGGPLEDRELDSGSCKVTRVAVNPDVLKECSEVKEDMELLTKLVFQFLGNQHEIRISSKRTVLKEDYVGDKSELGDFFGRRTNFERGPSVGGATDGLKDLTPETLLARMGRVSTEEDGSSWLSSEEGRPITEETRGGRPLIEEISSQGGADLPTPEYELATREGDDDRRGRRLVLRVALPGVSSVSECDLQIDDGEIDLHVSGRYRLEFRIPEPFREESVTAKFVKKTSTLSVTLPLESGPRDGSQTSNGK